MSTVMSLPLQGVGQKRSSLSYKGVDDVTKVLWLWSQEIDEDGNHAGHWREVEKSKNGGEDWEIVTTVPNFIKHLTAVMDSFHLRILRAILH